MHLKLFTFTASLSHRHLQQHSWFSLVCRLYHYNFNGLSALLQKSWNPFASARQCSGLDHLHYILHCVISTVFGSNRLVISLMLLPSTSSSFGVTFSLTGSSPVYCPFITLVDLLLPLIENGFIDGLISWSLLTANLPLSARNIINVTSALRLQYIFCFSLLRWSSSRSFHNFFGCIWRLLTIRYSNIHRVFLFIRLLATPLWIVPLVKSMLFSI